MKSYTSNVGFALTSNLRVLRDTQFQERCGSILKTVFPSIVQTPARGKLDQAGIDHCLFADIEDTLLMTVECKGFDVAEFGYDQLRQCLHSLETFANSEFHTTQHYLVVNRIVKGEWRRKIEAELAKLVENKKAQSAKLLDAHAFVEMVFQQAQKELRALLYESTSGFQEQHTSRMAENVYLQDVPFKLGPVTQATPLSFLLKEVTRLIALPNNKRAWFFVSGEFGFGKTSLALHIAEQLHTLGIASLYLPAAQFHKEGLFHDATFMWEALQIVLREEVDHANERHQILQAALKEIFKRDKRIILIFDGIDEHPICWQEHGLMNAFGIFTAFNAICLFTVREEFLAERAGHLAAATKKGPGSVFIQLTEWPNDLILKYTEIHLRTITINTIASRIEHFRDTIRNDKYLDYYGDIPRRPLFLKMLLEDVANGDVQTRNLSDIYATYIRKKFDADRSTSTSNPTVLRPLSLNEDYDVVCAKLFQVMTLAAAQMYVIEEGQVRLTARLSEDSLRACAGRVEPGLDLPSFLLNSVMVPVGRRSQNRSGLLDVRFAHTSFQEFFLARHVLFALQAEQYDPGLLSSELPKPVKRFLRGLLARLTNEEFAPISQKIAHLNLLGL